MILAAGLGTRLRPLTELRAKPALPVRGRPVIGLLLEFLVRHGIREVMINLHHLPGTIRAAVASDRPEGLEIEWSEEERPLGTGGGLRRAADFLRGSPDCVVLAGDMLMDFDLGALCERHRASGLAASLVLRPDRRGADFGTIGADERGHVCRIGERWIQSAPLEANEDAREREPRKGTEMSRGVFTGVRFFTRETLSDWPADDAFEDLRDWLVPGVERRSKTVGALQLEAQSSVWEPVGTPEEYLLANIDAPTLPTLGGPPSAWAGPVELMGANRDAIVDRRASVPDDVRLDRCVVWDGEQLPAGFSASNGVYAGGRFHACGDVARGPAVAGDPASPVRDAALSSTGSLS